MKQKEELKDIRQALSCGKASGMEIERKYLIDLKTLPFFPGDYPSHEVEQGYLSVNPVVRVRHSGDHYLLTLKSDGLMTRKESQFTLSRESYEHLLRKSDGIIIRKRRYRIPIKGQQLPAALDLYSGEYAGLAIAEVGFETEKEAAEFTPPSWFGREVTFTGEYRNDQLSRRHPSDWNANR